MLGGGFAGKYAVWCGVSRAPWLHPLVSWEESGTWGRGWTFDARPSHFVFGDVHEYAIGPKSLYIQRNDNVSFVNELRRGWTEAADCPPRDPDDVWDEKRSIILEKPSPLGGYMLRMHGGVFQSVGGVGGKKTRYEIHEAQGAIQTLDDAMWADWDASGRLLVATTKGELRIDRVSPLSREVLVLHDISNLTPEPRPAPEWATHAE